MTDKKTVVQELLLFHKYVLSVIQRSCCEFGVGQ